ncbi:MAG: hypothetical protein E6G39_14535 [Actinobacteria bacterium]|nr:MAG: hypothetical protein E6G39_14535 [Actinomycetota bacterium]
MRELVPDHVIGFAETRRKRQHDARLEALGKTAGPFAHSARAHIRLREIRMAGVEHDRLPLREGVVEQLRVARVPALRHPRRLPRDLFLFRVVINIEMLGAKRPELEASVLNLVPPEILRAGWCGPE